MPTPKKKVADRANTHGGTKVKRNMGGIKKAPAILNRAYRSGYGTGGDSALLDQFHFQDNSERPYLFIRSMRSARAPSVSSVALVILETISSLLRFASR